MRRWWQRWPPTTAPRRSKHAPSLSTPSRRGYRCGSTSFSPTDPTSGWDPRERCGLGGRQRLRVLVEPEDRGGERDVLAADRRQQVLHVPRVRAWPRHAVLADQVRNPRVGRRRRQRNLEGGLFDDGR